LFKEVLVNILRNSRRLFTIPLK